MSDKFDDSSFGQELDRLFEQSPYSKRTGGDDLERLATLTGPLEASTNLVNDVIPDDRILRGFWTLFSENGGGGAPSLEAAGARAEALQRLDSCHQPPAPDEKEEYMAAWQGFRATAIAIARVLRTCGCGEAARYADALDQESGPAHEKQLAPYIRARGEAIPLLAYVANRRRIYEELQNGICQEESLGHLLIVLGLGVEACAKLEATLRQLASVQ